MNPPILVELECPSCAGTLELPNTLDIAYCMYCGSKVLIHKDSGPDLDVIMELAYAAMEANDFAEAENHFTKFLEVDPNNVFGWLGKALCAGMQLNVYTLVDYPAYRDPTIYFLKAQERAKHKDETGNEWLSWSEDVGEYVTMIARRAEALLEGERSLQLQLASDEMQRKQEWHASYTYPWTCAEICQRFAFHYSSLAIFVHSWAWKAVPSLPGGGTLTAALNRTWTLFRKAKPIEPQHQHQPNLPKDYRDAMDRQYSNKMSIWKKATSDIETLWLKILRDPTENPHGTIEELMPGFNNGWESPWPLEQKEILDILPYI